MYLTLLSILTHVDSWKEAACKPQIAQAAVKNRRQPPMAQQEVT